MLRALGHGTVYADAAADTASENQAQAGRYDTVLAAANSVLRDETGGAAGNSVGPEFLSVQCLRLALNQNEMCLLCHLYI